MRLLSLELEDWAVHERLQLPLDGSLQIEGRNGTGKSSVLAAIRFVFSKDARGYARYIRNGSRSCLVRLSFSEKGCEYVVEKRLHLNGPASARMLAGESAVASNPTEVYARLQDILPENVLEKLLYVPQDGLVELIENLRVKGGRQELDALLGLDRFERVYKLASEELHEKEARCDEVDAQLKRFSPDTEKECSHGLRELGEDNRRLREEIEKEKKSLSGVESAVAGIEKDLDGMRAKKSQRDASERRANDLRLKEAEDGKMLEALEENLKSFSKRRERIKELSLREAELKKYPLLSESLAELVKGEDRLRELSEAAKKEKNLLALDKELAGLGNLREKEAAIDAGISEREKKLAGVGSLLAEKGDYVKDLLGLDGEAKCPRCGQNLTKAHLQKELKSAKADEKNFSEAASKLREEIDILKKALGEIRAGLDKLRKKELDAGCLRSELAENAAEKKRTEERIKAVREKLDACGYCSESAKEVDEKVAELNRLGGELSLLERELKQEDSLLEKRQKLAERLRRTAAEIRDVEAEAKRLEYDERAFEALQKEKEKLVDGAFGIRGRVREYELRMGHNMENEASLKSKLDEFIGLAARAEALRKESRLLREALDIFHTNKGIVKYLRERYIHELSSQMSFYFSRINQNPKYREIAFDKNYEIEVSTTEGSFSVGQLSGGERVQLAIALRIAMIRMLSPINLLILDEPFGSLDRDHRELLGEALNKIALDGQLILVTHVAVDSLNLPGRVEFGGY